MADQEQKTYTPEEAAVILKKAAQEKISAFEADLRELRGRELRKALAAKSLVPPHKHTTGTTASGGVEDVAPGRLDKGVPEDHEAKIAAQDKKMPKPIRDMMSPPDKATQTLFEDPEPKVLHPSDKKKVKKEEKSEETSSPDAGPHEETPGELSKNQLMGYGPGAPPPMPSLQMASKEAPAAKAELCKDCGKMHLGKCGDIKVMDKAMLSDAKGNQSDNGIRPDSKLPGDAPEKEISADGSGGKIKKGKSLKGLQKSARESLRKGMPFGDGIKPGSGTPAGTVKAEPPMAQPPSGKNPSTHMPASKPGTMMKQVDSVVVHGKTQKPKLPVSQRDYTAKVGKDKAVFQTKKSELEKAGLPATPKAQSQQHAMMAGSKNAVSAPAVAAPGPKLPGADVQAQRAQTHQSALAGAFQPKGPVNSGLELDLPKKPGALASPKAAGIAAAPMKPAAKKPGIFGRLMGKTEKK